ncbi:MAG: hypothetical protein KGI38_11740 [Thaumarchaeota archaeon]|nr:hypothetical protein [Nitrososphaerota archaeon]
MTSTKKEFVYLIDLPFVIRKATKEGFQEFRISILDPKRTSRERVQVRYWRNVPSSKNKTCPDCGFEVNNSINLLAHQRKARHGEFAEPKALYSAEEAIPT